MALPNLPGRGLRTVTPVTPTALWAGGAGRQGLALCPSSLAPSPRRPTWAPLWSPTRVLSDSQKALSVPKSWNLRVTPTFFPWVSPEAEKFEVKSPCRQERGWGCHLHLESCFVVNTLDYLLLRDTPSFVHLAIFRNGGQNPPFDILMRFLGGVLASSPPSRPSLAQGSLGVWMTIQILSGRLRVRPGGWLGEGDQEGQTPGGGVQQTRAGAGRGQRLWAGDLDRTLNSFTINCTHLGGGTRPGPGDRLQPAALRPVQGWAYNPDSCPCAPGPTPWTVLLEPPGGRGAARGRLGKGG